MVNNITLFSSDSSVKIQVEDRFQRYQFAKRIAQSIIDYEGLNSLAYGIYGSWGEGKTSVLNFIEYELERNNVISLKFNPWRFIDENTLIMQFFNELANKYDSSLSSKSEKIGQFLGKYGKLLSGAGSIGAGIKDLGNFLSDVDLETIKERVEKMLIENGQKIVVFIDDIDRLEKTEVYSILKLVKLTGNFSNILYILAFDEERVSACLEERFGGSDKSGMSFIEKIVQIPLHIPAAQPEALEIFCNDRIKTILSNNQLVFRRNDVTRFLTDFHRGILEFIKTPRHVVRYTNAIAFGLPLLKDLINIVDYFLVEAIKVFLPKHYEFIKSNSLIFITREIIVSQSRDVDLLKKKYEELNKDLTNSEILAINYLLSSLFPGNLLFDTKNETEHNIVELNFYNDKRIASSHYFRRYFSYSVIKGEIPDLEFDEFVSKINLMTSELVREKLNYFIKLSSLEILLIKIRNSAEYLDDEALIIFIAGLSNMSDELLEMTSFEYRLYPDSKFQLAFLLFQLFEKITDKSEQYFIACQLIKTKSSFDFVVEMNTCFRIGNSRNEKLFNDDQYEQIAIILINRAKDESKDLPIFVKYPKHTRYLFNSWKRINELEFNNYISNVLEETPMYLAELIQSFATITRDSIESEEILSDLTQVDFDSLVNLVDAQLIYNIIKNIYEFGKIKNETPLWKSEYNSQTDRNLVRQFLYWYNLEATK